ncbi:MAG: hypothetical protein RSA64_02270, partial [Christensenellaceae bacterium]
MNRKRNHICKRGFLITQVLICLGACFKESVTRTVRQHNCPCRSCKILAWISLGFAVDRTKRNMKIRNFALSKRNALRGSRADRTEIER